MKLGILGAGMIVKDFLSMVAGLPQIELKGILGTERDLVIMEEFQESYKIEQIYTDIDECLSNETIDTIYVALPNHLHYHFTKKALESGKHVICEKPFTLSYDQLLELESIAVSKNLILIEAITNQYLANYKAIQKELKTLGNIKLVECNYSQYSSRYDLFQEGTVLPAFNPKLGGGALMDINIYNIHFIVGLFGEPEEVHYYANIERGIDTSGMLILEYPDIKVVCIGAKDSTSEIQSTIQGTEGSIIIKGPTNIVDSYKKDNERIDLKIHPHRMYEEFKVFDKIIASRDFEFAKKQLDHSKKVMNIVEKAIKHAGISLG
ncbi:Gfo/Idh/MocA family protein [Marinilactibacillus psychrotolerans]|uniref:NAD-dependent oxidoreductase n=1 Tax=Marinilactibacillus psychrotolerans 42ea TaxID=1255609 RepID=A0A1R4JYJ7_9LACT|nr:Gfo/Idh/MocA family oxidoreductase [Marinilactibacillus psychrotolerans]SJN36843.1 NAD-dependent oxidoreductase [Marinilactibacillus psychrotolerans 42ea]